MPRASMGKRNATAASPNATKKALTWPAESDAPSESCERNRFSPAKYQAGSPITSTARRSHDQNVHSPGMLAALLITMVIILSAFHPMCIAPQSLWPPCSFEQTCPAEMQRLCELMDSHTHYTIIEAAVKNLLNRARDRTNNPLNNLRQRVL